MQSNASKRESHPDLSHYIGPRYWPTWLALTIMRVLSVLPLPVLAVFGYIIGSLFYLLHASRRKIAFKNLKACFPEETDSKLNKVNWLHFCMLGHSVMTACMHWWIRPARFDRLVTITGREDYDLAIAQGRNIVLLAPHFMSLEVSGLALQRERPMIGVYQYMKNKLMNTVALRGRQRFCPGGLMFERKQPLRTLLRVLRKGLPMSYSPDQDAGRKGVFVPFFHTLSSTTPALAKFILTTNAVVIPCRNSILPWGQGYGVELGPRIEGLASGDEEKDTAAMNRAIEAMIRKAPEQYLWVHKRFKTRPEGEAKFY